MSHLSDRPENAVVGLTMEHESAVLHVTGHALYTDDLVRRSQHVLHAHPVQAPHAHARITRLDPTPADRGDEHGDQVAEEERERVGDEPLAGRPAPKARAERPDARSTRVADAR